MAFNVITGAIDPLVSYCVYEPLTRGTYMQTAGGLGADVASTEHPFPGNIDIRYEGKLSVDGARAEHTLRVICPEGQWTHGWVLYTSSATEWGDVYGLTPMKVELRQIE